MEVYQLLRFIWDNYMNDITVEDMADISCRQCPYLSSNERMCQLNKQPVQYPSRFVGAYCPLKIEALED